MHSAYGCLTLQFVLGQVLLLVGVVEEVLGMLGWYLGVQLHRDLAMVVLLVFETGWEGVAHGECHSDLEWVNTMMGKRIQVEL